MISSIIHLLASDSKNFGDTTSESLSKNLPSVSNADTTLDGETRRQEAQTEKEFLISQLREMLEQTSRKTLMEQERDEAQALQEKLQKVPYPIYIG